MMRHMRQTYRVIRSGAWDKCYGLYQKILDRFFVILLGLLLLSIPASATSSHWSETLDIAMSIAPTGMPVMLCIVDSTGQAQCHHQDGILICRPGVAGGAVCPGGAKQFLSSCPDASQCVFDAVPVPPDAFGLLLLEIRPPLFGVQGQMVLWEVFLSPPSRDWSLVSTCRPQRPYTGLGPDLPPPRLKPQSRSQGQYAPHV